MSHSCGFTTINTVRPSGPAGAGLISHRSVSLSLYDQLRDPRFAPPPLVDRMIAAGQLGRKSGEGFYRYGTTGTFGT